MVSTVSSYHKRRAQMIDYLGGACVVCGATQNLHFDHVDPRQKTFSVSSNWSIAWVRLSVELDKCQLLCPPHHDEKSKSGGDYQGGQNRWPEIKHGTVWAYSKYKCRCDECRKAYSKYRSEYRRNKKRGIA